MRTLAATRAQGEAASAASARTSTALGSRARVLQRFGRVGYFRVLLEARDASGFLQGLERLDGLARRDGRLLAAHRASQRQLETDLAREEAIRTELDQNWTNSRRELVAMSNLRNAREALLARERRAATTGRDEVHALSDKADRLERRGQTLERQSSGEAAGAAGGIRPWKGVLDWPARGAVVETFGRHRHPRFDAWTVSNGVALALSAGTPVRAVYAGKAVYAQWLAEYGNLVILDHGDGVFTLYGRLATGTIERGARIAIGDRLGLLGETPEDEVAGLYFEIRDNRSSVDPAHWLR